MRFLLFLLTCCLLGWWYLHTPTVVQGPGILVENEPFQDREYFGKGWSHEGYEITPLAAYKIKARVLGIERYRMGNESIAPFDLALGWQEMSNSAVLDQLSVKQSNRWYYINWATSPPPLPEGDIFYKSANTHIIPANDKVKSDIGGLSIGNVVSLEGYLIRASLPDGWKWQSSLSRGDRGDHSCELMWVDKVSVER